jgi:hypothetical protein
MMSADQIVAVGTAATACIAAVASARNMRKIDQGGKKIDQVHVLVNQRMTDAIARIDQLTARLEESDVSVPIDPHPPRT